MALNKYSAFYYGHTITKSNYYINIGEAYLDPIERVGRVAIGAYTLTKFGDLVATALNSAGSQEYTVTLDRTTRKFTISAVNNFELLLDTGSNKTTSVYTLLGFTGTVDLTGSNSYEADSQSGEAYITQTPLANFSDFKYNKEKAEAVVRSTPAGITEVISYSTLERMICDFPAITNYVPQRFIRATETGLDEAEAFLDYCITKAPMEFLENYEEVEYTPCILDKTSKNSKGVGYQLKERVRDQLPGYYSIAGLTFLKIEVK
jgi:hypothetical protein